LKKVFTSILGLVFSFVGFSQSCLPDGIIFTTQAHIDSFQVNYPNCTQIEGNVTISGSNITNLNGLSIVTSIEGKLQISDNASLNSLTGLESLTSIGGNIELESNDTLTSLTGLEGLTSIGGDLYISDNNALNSLNGLEGLTSIEWSLQIYYNDALTSLTGLEGIPSIGGDLHIINNVTLTSLTGLEGLTTIGGSLIIGDWDYGGNASLTSLTGLEGLTSIGGNIELESNDALTSLTGLDNIDAGSINDIYIKNNESLSTCDVQSICNYLASPNGTVEIHDNATGCNSEVEVDSTCVYLSTDEINIQHAFSIYPNPASTIITIETPITPDNNTFMTIFNINGQALLSRQINDPIINVDVSGLPQGIYFVKVSDDRTVMVWKFVVQ